MKLLTMGKPGTGTFWYREQMPAEQMVRTGHTSDIYPLDGSTFQPSRYDALVFPRSFDLKSNLPQVALNCHRGRQPVVVDQDDAMDLAMPDNFAYEQIVEALPGYFFLLSQADLVTCTTQTLADHLKKFTKNGNVKVIPNLIDWEWAMLQSKRAKREQHTLPRIGFAGTSTHLPEILVVMEALIEAQKEKDFEFVLFGFGGTTDWLAWANKNLDIMRPVDKDYPLIPLFERFITLAEKITHFRFEPLVPIDQYLSRLCQLNFDIGLCPLPDTPFARCKSPIKFHEYIISGAIPIAQYSPVYESCSHIPHTIVSDLSSKAWCHGILTELSHFPNPNEKAIDWLLDMSRSIFSIEENGKIREKIFEELLSKKV
jgi:hypothetical protein